MKKKILSVALIAMSLAAFSGVAQNVTNDSSVKTEKVRGNRSDKQDQRSQRNPYEGLTLTDSQKSQLQQLESKRQEARQQQVKDQQDKKQQDRNARMEARKASKKEYLKEVKAIVGPDQYVVFLENMYVNGGQHHGNAIQQGKRGTKQGFANNKSGKRDRQKESKKGSNNAQRGNRQQSKATQS